MAKKLDSKNCYDLDPVNLFSHIKLGICTKLHDETAELSGIQNLPVKIPRGHRK